MSGKIVGTGAELLGVDENNGDKPFGLIIKYKAVDCDSFVIACDSLKAICSCVQSKSDPKKGCVVYAFSKRLDDESIEIEMVEIFADLESASTHVTEGEGEAAVEIFSEKVCQGVITGAINAPRCTRESTNSLNPKSITITKGSLINPIGLLGGRWGRRILGSEGEGIMLNFRMEPRNDAEGEQIVNTLKHLVNFEKQDFCKVSAYIATGSAWWIRSKRSSGMKIRVLDIPVLESALKSKFTDNAIEMRLIYSHKYLKHLFTSELVHFLADLQRNLESFFFSITAEDWIHEEWEELVEHFQDRGLNVDERRVVFAGHLIHPFYTKNWEEEAASVATTTPTVPKPPSSQQHKDTRSVPFYVRYHAIKATPEAIVFEPKKHLHNEDIDKTVLTIPLTDVLRSMTGLSNLGRELPIGVVFGNLERLRTLEKDVALYNSVLFDDDFEIENELMDSSSLSEDESADCELSVPERLKRLEEVMNGMGYPIQPRSGLGSGSSEVPQRRTISVDGISSLIDVLKKEFSSVMIENGVHNLFGSQTVDYLALQEIYPIGCIVLSRGLGNLSGTLTSFRVIDSYYEAVRSLLGNLKYSFRMKLETICGIGCDFVSVAFTVILEEWKRPKLIKDLLFVPTSKIPSEIASRSRILSSLIEKQSRSNGKGREGPSFMSYGGGTFFPVHTGRRKLLRTSAIRNANSGTVILDSLRGLELGIAPASSNDEFGLAILEAMRAFRTVSLSNSESSSSSIEMKKKRKEKLESMGIQVHSALPARFKPIWPCVVGFSLSLKSWGYVLIDELVEVQAQPSIWDCLVLPSKTKEILMAMSKNSLIGSGRGVERSCVQPRYRFRDFVESRGSGSLILLYGPPGCGKTLTVEALAACFGRPLYSLSFSELGGGSSVSDLEERLTDVLDLAASWGAFVCLDEGDALVEKRTKGALVMNSMTGVLLRLLETFHGCLFITSNRIAVFDPAALSRVTLAVQFDPLSEHGKKKVWTDMLTRVFESEKGGNAESQDHVSVNFNLDLLAQFRGSGRSVGAVIRLAIGLTEERNCELDMNLLSDALKIWSNFHDDLTEMHQ